VVEVAFNPTLATYHDTTTISTTGDSHLNSAYQQVVGTFLRICVAEEQRPLVVTGPEVRADMMVLQGHPDHLECHSMISSSLPLIPGSSTVFLGAALTASTALAEAAVAGPILKFATMPHHVVAVEEEEEVFEHGA